MKTWEDYKKAVKAQSVQSKKDMEEIEAQAEIISKLIAQRTALGLSQRDLAALCDMPQSSIARMESCKTTPNLETILKVMKPLGLKLQVTAMV